MPITPITAAPTPAASRGTPSAQFVTRADALAAWFPTFTTEFNVAAPFINSAITSAEAALSQSQVLTAAVNSAANFKGSWSNLTGALDVPASVENAGAIWQLLGDIADVTASEPAVDNDDWLLMASSISLAGDTSVYINTVNTYTITNFNSFSTYSVAAVRGVISISGDTITYTGPATVDADTISITKDGAASSFDLVILPASVETPVNQTPTNGTTDTGPSLNFVGSDFVVFGVADTHASSDWQIATDEAFTTIVDSTTGDTVNLTAWAGEVTATSTVHYWRVRYTSANGLVSDYSSPFTFTTASAFFPSAEVAKIVASDAEGNDDFGFSVSIDGDYAIVGAKDEDTASSNAGAAYIYFRDAGGSWSQQAKLLASNAGFGDRFGYSVSISGDYAIVGAYAESAGGSQAGTAYVFVRSGTSWSQQSKLVASDAQASDFFGFSVSISGDYAVVGAYREDAGGTDAGAAYVFARSGTSWSQQAKLVASDAEVDDFFGYSVSISGDYAVVGAIDEDAGGTGAGAAYVFARSGTSWSQQSKLVASDAQASDFFGGSVSISGSFAVVGADGEDDGGSAAGAAYIFE